MNLIIPFTFWNGISCLERYPCLCSIDANTERTEQMILFDGWRRLTCGRWCDSFRIAYFTFMFCSRSMLHPRNMYVHRNTIRRHKPYEIGANTERRDRTVGILFGGGSSRTVHKSILRCKTFTRWRGIFTYFSINTHKWDIQSQKSVPLGNIIFHSYVKKKYFFSFQVSPP